MNTDFAKRFDNDVKKITDIAVTTAIEQAILNVEEALTMRDIARLRKLKGYRIYYRIKIGRYRIGTAIEGNLVTFLRCLPRKDFYKYFP